MSVQQFFGNISRQDNISDSLYTLVVANKQPSIKLEIRQAHFIQGNQGALHRDVIRVEIEKLLFGRQFFLVSHLDLSPVLLPELPVGAREAKAQEVAVVGFVNWGTAGVLNLHGLTRLGAGHLNVTRGREVVATDVEQPRVLGPLVVAGVLNPETFHKKLSWSHLEFVAETLFHKSALVVNARQGVDGS